jgi:phosphopantetheinyl transferase (holo-ACP synthase)
MSDQGSSFLESVLKERSIKEIRKLSPYAVQLANRWAKEAPGKTRELEATGKLLASLKERAESEALLQWRSRMRAVRGEKEAPPAP